VCAFAASTASAQIRPETQWALGLGISVLGTGGYGGSSTGFGLAGSYTRMFNNTLGFEAEGRMSASSSASEAIPSCVPGAYCAASTIIPASVVGADLRLLYRPVRQLRLSAGPAIAYAPGAVGPNSGVVGGVSGGVGIFPFGGLGNGIGLETRATKFFSPLGEVEWAFGTGLSWRF
jgi:hypothetical protein